MNPLFFGKSGRACFGIHHAAARPARSHGVVLCNPFGDEALAILATEPGMAGILDKEQWV